MDDTFNVAFEQSDLKLNPLYNKLFASQCNDHHLLNKHSRIRIVKVNARPAASWFDLECCNAEDKR